MAAEELGAGSLREPAYKVGDKVQLLVYNRPEFRTGEVVEVTNEHSYRVKRSDGRVLDMDANELAPIVP